jgi:hypothetical protein
VQGSPAPPAPPDAVMLLWYRVSSLFGVSRVSRVSRLGKISRVSRDSKVNVTSCVTLSRLLRSLRQQYTCQTEMCHAIVTSVFYVCNVFTYILSIPFLSNPSRLYTHTHTHTHTHTRTLTWKLTPSLVKGLSRTLKGEWG